MYVAMTTLTIVGLFRWSAGFPGSGCTLVVGAPDFHLQKHNKTMMRMSRMGPRTAPMIQYGMTTGAMVTGGESVTMETTWGRGELMT